MIKLDPRWIYYKCKDCGWMTRIMKQWAGDKPSKCMARKCKAHFIKNPEKLEILVVEESKKLDKSAPKKKITKKPKDKPPVEENELSVSED